MQMHNKDHAITIKVSGNKFLFPLKDEDFWVFLMVFCTISGIWGKWLPFMFFIYPFPLVWCVERSSSRTRSLSRAGSWSAGGGVRASSAWGTFLAGGKTSLHNSGTSTLPLSLVLDNPGFALMLLRQLSYAIKTHLKGLHCLEGIPYISLCLYGIRVASRHRKNL